MARSRVNSPPVPLNSGRFMPGATNLDYVIEPPRKEPSGKTNAEEMRARVEQKSNTRETPVRRIDPNTGEWISTRSEAVPNDRVTMLLNMVFDADPEVRALAADMFKGLPAEQKKVIAIEVANQFPNARGVSGRSPMGDEIMAMLQGAPASPERLRAIQEAAQAGDGRAGWTSEKGAAGREATQDMEFDDSPAIDMAPESNIDNLDQPAPGDLATTEEGKRRPKMPPRGKQATVKQDTRPDLRGPNTTTQLAVIGEGKDRRLLPVRIATDEGKIGPQDYPPIKQGRKYERAMDARGQALADAIHNEFGDLDEFRSQLAEANRTGDTETLNDLMGRVKALQDEIEQRVKVPEKPYPVNEINAANSEKGSEAKVTDHAMRFAAGDPDAGARLWKMISRDQVSADGKTTKSFLSPLDAGIPTPEEYADTILASMDPNRLPGNVDDFRQRLIAQASDVYYSGNPIPSPGPASAEPDKFARNPLTAGKEPKRPSELDSWDAAAQRRGQNADIGSEQDKGRDLSAAASQPGPDIPGLNSSEGTQGLNDYWSALTNKVALARQNGFIPYRDPDTGAIIRGRVTSNTKPEKLQFMLDNHAADLVPDDLPGQPAGHQVEEMNARIQKFQALLDSMNQGSGRTGTPFTDADREALAARTDPFDPSWQEVAPGQRVRLKGQGDTFGFIDDTVDPDDVLFNPNSKYDIEVMDDVPYLKERSQDARPMDMADDSPVVGSEDVSPEDAHADLVRVIEDPASPEEALAKARADYAQYKKVLQSIKDPEQRAAFSTRYVQPLDDAAARRRQATAAPAVADNVRDNLDASATPIDDEPTPPPSEVVIPKDENPSVHSDSNAKPQQPPKPVEAVANQNADAGSAARDAEGETADAAAKIDAAVNPAPANKTTVTPAAAPTLRDRAASMMSSAGRNWPLIAGGIGGLYGLNLVNQIARQSPIYAPGEDMLDGGPQQEFRPEVEMMQPGPLSPEERIRRARILLNGGQRLIPQTLSRPT